MTSEAVTAYDVITYPSHPCPQTHPDHLATLATLFGMTPAPAAKCRVLELGCGEGGNLLPMAFTLAESTFVGIDLAASAIAKAKEETRAFRLSNIEFHCADLLDWTPPEGPFDYIIAHGFFSWVPEVVRLRVLELLRERLAPQGVAYISYNALPGCHISGMLREMMRFHTQPFPSPAQKIQQARALLAMLVAGQPKESAFATLLRKEAERLLNRQADPILFHDDLADINQAYYFHEFAALAGKYDLQFLAEADCFEMQDAIHPPVVIEALKQFAGNIVLKEQYLDFVKCRRFRQTLLCHNSVRLERALEPGLVGKFLIASQTKPNSANPDLSQGVFEGFTGPRGATIRTDDPLTKAAMLELLAAWPCALSFDDVVKAASSRLGRMATDLRPDEINQLAEVVLAIYGMGLVELHLHQPAEVGLRKECPVLSPLARAQLLHGLEIVTGLRHNGTRVNVPAARAMLLLLDGTRDMRAVAAELGRRIDAGELPLPVGSMRENLQADVEKGVRDAVADGLLSAWPESC